MVPEKWSPQWGFESLSHESSALITRPRLLALVKKLTYSNNFAEITKLNFKLFLLGSYSRENVYF
jgi:hypothetical protein